MNRSKHPSFEGLTNGAAPGRVPKGMEAQNERPEGGATRRGARAGAAALVIALELAWVALLILAVWWLLS